MESKAGRLFIAIATAVCVGAFSLFSIGVLVLFMTGNNVAAHDFIAYWSAGKLLAAHGNPYDSSAVLAVQRSAGFDQGLHPLLMRNPPPSLWIAWPFGYMSLRLGALIWSAILAISLGLSVWMLRTVYRQQSSISILLGISFAPVLACLLAGQSSILVALGYTLFLRFHRIKPLWAGLGLWACAIKPHLFIPVVLVLLLWSFTNKKNSAIAFAGLSITISSLAALLFDPHIYSHYREMLSNPVLRNEFIPCISIALRALSPRHPAVMQFLPVTIACIWAAFYYLRHANEWRWEDHGNLLLLVSLATAPYAWVSDQAVALPAIIQLSGIRSRTILALTALASATIEIQVLSRVSFHSPAFLWSAPAWLLLYLIASRQRLRPENLSAPPLAQEPAAATVKP